MQKKLEMEFENINIEELLPQQRPFVMIDKLLYCDTQTTKTSFAVREDNIFAENGYLLEAGVIENIAQTCAVQSGNIDKCTDSDSVKIGFIGAIRNMTFIRLPKVGEILYTQVDTIAEVFQMTLVNATVRVEDEIIASGEMKISLTNIEI